MASATGRTANLTRHPLRSGDRLPPLVLPEARGRGEIAWRAPSRGEPVVVFLTAPESERGTAYLRALGSAAERFRLWNGRPLIVVPETGADVVEAPPGAVAFPVAIDAGGEARRRCGVADGVNAVFIADRWGQIYHASRAESEDELPEPAEIEEWLRFIATQCPECGVPDEPGQGEWAR